jgi:hypothetical protein
VALEDLIEVFSTEPAANIRALREKYKPGGSLDLTTRIRQPGGSSDTLTDVEASNLRDLQFTAFGGRFGLTNTTGLVTVATGSAPGPGTLTADKLEADLTFEGEPSGHVAANGCVGTDWNPAPQSAQPLTITISGGQLDSALTKKAISDAGPKSLLDFYSKSNPRGSYDLDLTASGPQLRGVFHPHSLTLTMNGTEVDFPSASGSIEFSGGEGRLRAVSLAAPKWSVQADGSWLTTTPMPGGTAGTAFQTSLTLNASSLSPDLLAVLPEDLRDVIHELSFETGAPIQTKDSQLALTFDEDGKLSAFKAQGRATLLGAKLDIGASVQGMGGTVDYLAMRTAPRADTDVELWALLDNVSVSGVRMTNGRVRLASAGKDILIPLISADCHGGRIAGSAIIAAAAKQGGPRRYEAQIQASDVRFAPVIQDFEDVAPTQINTPIEEPATPDESRGRLDAGFSLAGTVGDPLSRRGRGTATVGGGRIVNIPLLVPLVRVTNLQFPIDERLDYAVGDFYLESNRIVFNELSVSSRSVGLYGYGIATLPDLALDLRFRPRNSSRIPVITGALEGVRNELVAATVRGTLAKPDISVTSLTGATRILERVFGVNPSEEQRMLDQIEQRAEQDPRRSRPGTQSAVSPR